MWAWLPGPLNFLLLLVGMFMILLVLIQRGKGGGLIGALGGTGGSSPFGSRAGDLFTRITIIAAIVWGLLIVVHVKVVQPSQSPPPQAAATTPEPTAPAGAPPAPANPPE